MSLWRRLLSCRVKETRSPWNCFLPQQSLSNVPCVCIGVSAVSKHTHYTQNRERESAPATAKEKTKKKHFDMEQVCRWIKYSCYSGDGSNRHLLCTGKMGTMPTVYHRYDPLPLYVYSASSRRRRLLRLSSLFLQGHAFNTVPCSSGRCCCCCWSRYMRRLTGTRTAPSARRREKMQRRRESIVLQGGDCPFRNRIFLREKRAPLLAQIRPRNNNGLTSS